MLRVGRLGGEPVGAGHRPTRARPRGATIVRTGGGSRLRHRAFERGVGRARHGRRTCSRVPHDERGRLTGERAGRTALDADGGDGVFAVVASAGSTNAGTVDDLARCRRRVRRPRDLVPRGRRVRRRRACWLPPSATASDGIERADSFIVDPHKWLFAPYDACALLYRDPSLALRRAPAGWPRTSTRRSPRPTGTRPTTRTTCPAARAGSRCGSRSPRTAPTPIARPSRHVLTITRETAAAIDAAPRARAPDGARALRRALPADRVGTRRVRRLVATRLLDAQIAFVQPTSWRARRSARLCFVNPRTTMEHVRAVLERDAPERPSYAIWRPAGSRGDRPGARSMRCSVGGCVENRLPNPDRRPASGFMMNRCASAGLSEAGAGTCFVVDLQLAERARERGGIVREVGARLVGLVLARARDGHLDDRRGDRRQDPREQQADRRRRGRRRSRRRRTRTARAA